jgi:hypothetical protein
VNPTNLIKSLKIINLPMEKYNIDQEAHLKVQKIWDGKAEWYAKYV